MASPKRLVLFVEGEGDRDAGPILVSRLLTEMGAWESLFLDDKPFVVGSVDKLTADENADWLRFLKAAGRRKNLGAVLLLLDGDITPIRGEPFCPVTFGRRLAQQARDAGAGAVFSVATVFACREFESWALAALDRLAGLHFPDGRPGVPVGTDAPAGDLEVAPRDAKGFLDRVIAAGYKPTRDQGPLTRLLVDHLGAVRDRSLRSFRRLEEAVRQLHQAVRTGQHIATPSPLGPASP
jgi:hypothetical protein